MMKCSRSVFEPTMPPMYADFEAMGMVGAMSRLVARLRPLVSSFAFPAWLWSLDFAHAVSACSAHSDMPGLIDRMHRATEALGGGTNDPKYTQSRAPTASQQAATARLHFGEMLEALAVSTASALVPLEEVPGASVDQASLAMLYYDAYCVAVWTSAHAEYLATVQDLLGGREATEEQVRSLMVPSPDLYTVTNLSHLVHLGPLNDRAASPRCCAKSAQSLLAILARVTNAGSRGWETTLMAAAKESDGAVRVCTQSIVVALSGMHPAIHPAARRSWRARFVMLRAMRVQTTQDFKDLVRLAPVAMKETIRLHLAAVFVLDCATLEALRHKRQPTGQLGIPPLALPHPSLAAAMHRMADAGEHMVTSRESAAASIQRHLVSEPRSRKKSTSSTGARHARELQVETLSYCTSWLGGRSGPLGTTVRSGVQVVSGLMSASYRSIFIPWWLHGNHHGHRASRLDSAQYAALHNRSAAHRMCTLLSDEDFWFAERVAIGAPDASLLTVSEACALLGICRSENEPPGVPCAASSRAVQEAESEVMELSARDAALLFAFARIASLRATMLSYDLGEGTRRRQALAICQRLMLPLAPGEDPCEAVCTRLPQHASTLYCCSECRRVVNSVQDNTGKDQPFNELGLSASMLSMDGDLCDWHMRCAKRSSAALRTAVALEAAAKTLELERLDPVSNPLLPNDLNPATIVSTMCKTGKRKGRPGDAASTTATALRDSSSEVAKFRRDLKSCFEQEQETTSCGDVPLVRVPILGRAIRIFGNWYALCSMCGALSRVTPASRFQGDICCMHCDFAMLAGKEAAEEMRNALPRPPPPACRFCHKVEPENGTGMKWKRVDAPADTGGHNACVPPPLRVCYYCPTHYRAWLVNAHKTMSTTDIISHLVARARPIFGASAEAKNGATKKRLVANGEEGERPPPKKQSAASKRKSALTRVIAKNNRNRRLNGAHA